jgi:bacteriocin-like protein
MRSLDFNKRSLQRADVLSKTEMKKIIGGHDYDPDCPVGTYELYEGPEGCGTVHYLSSDGNGNCTAQLNITGQQPCGWC